MFDVADTKIGDESRSGVPIHDLKDLKKIVRKEHIDIAVIAVPAESAQHVLDQVVAAGIKAILNFSPGALKVPAGVKMKGVDLTVSLESLSFYWLGKTEGVRVPVHGSGSTVGLSRSQGPQDGGFRPVTSRGRSRAAIVVARREGDHGAAAKRRARGWVSSGFFFWFFFPIQARPPSWQQRRPANYPFATRSPCRMSPST